MTKQDMENELNQKLSKMRDKGFDNAANMIEKFEPSELLEEGMKKDLKKDFPEAEEQIDSLIAGLHAVKEISSKRDPEGTELTEGSETELEIEDFLNEPESNEVRLSGYLDRDTYFHVLLARRNEKLQPLVITSDKEFYKVKNKKNELKKQNKHVENLKRYDYQFFSYQDKEYRLKHKVKDIPTLSIFKPDNPTLEYLKDKEPSKEVYEEVRSKIKKYWDHYDEEWFDIVAAWIIHTYLINRLGYTVYLMPKGKENTGKTTLQKVLARLSYNGFFSGKTTSAVTSRVAHYTQATLHLDEFDKNADKEIEGVFNTGQRKGGKYSFTNMNKQKVENQITSLYSFCAKTLSVNSLHDFDSHFLSRNIILEATRTERSLENIDTLSKQQQKDFQQLRNHLMAYSLLKNEIILNSVEEYKNDLEESGREADKISVICGLIRHFKDQKRAKEIKKFLESQEQLQESQIDQKLKILLEELTERFDEEQDQIEVNPGSLATHINRVLNRDEEYEVSARGVGNVLREHDILRKDWQSSRSGANGETVYEIPRVYLEDSLKRYGFEDMREKLAIDNGSVPSGSSVDSVDRTIRHLGGDEKPISEQEVVVASELPEEEVEEVIEKRKSQGEYLEPEKNKIKLSKNLKV
jgi:hypothetical protein